MGTNGVQQLWQTMTRTKGFDKILQTVKILSGCNGSCKAEMTVAEEHTNTVGTLHGGMTSTIVDSVSVMAMEPKHIMTAVSIDMHITFLKGVGVGEQILIEAKADKVGRTLAFLQVYISNKKSGAMVAKGSHTVFIGK